MSFSHAPPPRITVAIAAYNATPFISRAIRSALDQEGVDLEVVVVDDASTDGTASYVESEFGDEPRVRVFSLSINSGPGAARNAAISKARGEWFAVLDADDAYLSSHLRKLIELAEEHAADIISGGFTYYSVNPDLHDKYALAKSPVTQTLDKASFLAGARPYTKEADFGLLKPLFKKRFLDEHQVRYPQDVRHGEDFEFVFHALLKGARYILRRDVSSYAYTTRDSGQSRTVVDYRGLVRRSELLLRNPAVNADTLVHCRMKERIDALIQLDLNMSWGLGVRKRASALARAIVRIEGRRWLWQRVVQRLVRGR